MLSRLRQTGEALHHPREVQRPSRALAQAGTRGHEHRLATSLTVLAAILTQLGRSEGALTAVEEALDIRQRMAAQGDARTASSGEPSSVLHTLTAALEQPESDVDPLTRVYATVGSLPRPVRAGPKANAFARDLCTLWQTLGMRLSLAARFPEALEPTEEAVTSARRLAPAYPFFRSAGRHAVQSQRHPVGPGKNWASQGFGGRGRRVFPRPVRSHPGIRRRLGHWSGERPAQPWRHSVDTAGMDSGARHSGRRDSDV